MLAGRCGPTAAARSMREHHPIPPFALRPVTISVGAATFMPGEVQPDLDQAQELVKEADKALYLAKRNGRNQVQHFLDMPPGLRIHQAHGRGARRAA